MIKLKHLIIFLLCTLTKSSFNIRTYVCMYIYSKEKTFVDNQFNIVEERYQFSNNDSERKEKTRNNYNLILFKKCGEILNNMDDHNVYLRLNDILKNTDKFIYRYYFELKEEEIKSVIFPLGNGYDKIIKDLQFINNAKEGEVRNYVGNFYRGNMEEPSFRKGVNFIFKNEDGIQIVLIFFVIILVCSSLMVFFICYCQGRTDREFKKNIYQTIEEIEKFDQEFKKKK